MDREQISAQMADLLQAQSAARSAMIEAQTRMEAEAKTGKGPKYEEARQAFEAAQSTLGGMDQQVGLLNNQLELLGKQADSETATREFQQEQSSPSATAMQLAPLLAGGAGGKFLGGGIAESTLGKNFDARTRAVSTFGDAAQEIRDINGDASQVSMSGTRRAKMSSAIDTAFDAGGMSAPFQTPGLRQTGGGESLFRPTTNQRIGKALFNPVTAGIGFGVGEAALARAFLPEDATPAQTSASNLGVGLGVGVAGGTALEGLKNAQAMPRPSGRDVTTVTGALRNLDNFHATDPENGAVRMRDGVKWQPVTQGERNIRATQAAEVAPTPRGMMARALAHPAINNRFVDRAAAAMNPALGGATIGAGIGAMIDGAQASDGENQSGDASAVGTGVGAAAGAAAPFVKGGAKLASRLLPGAGTALLAHDVGRYIYDDLNAPDPTPEEVADRQSRTNNAQDLMRQNMARLLSNRVAQ